MKSKALAVQSILEMAENRANVCQVPGHYPSSYDTILFGFVVLLIVVAG
jgi:hypothetical protein